MLAHMKRKVIDAEKAAPEIAREAVERVRALYAVERQGKDASVEETSEAASAAVGAAAGSITRTASCLEGTVAAQAPHGGGCELCAKASGWN